MYVIRGIFRYLPYLLSLLVTIIMAVGNFCEILFIRGDVFQRFFCDLGVTFCVITVSQNVPPGPKTSPGWRFCNGRRLQRLFLRFGGMSCKDFCLRFGGRFCNGGRFATQQTSESWNTGLESSWRSLLTLLCTWHCVVFDIAWYIA